MGPISSSLLAVLITISIVAVVLLFIAIVILLGWAIWNSQLDRVIAIIGALNIPIFGAAVILWKWLFDKNQPRD